MSTFKEIILNFIKKKLSFCKYKTETQIIKETLSQNTDNIQDIITTLDIHEKISIDVNDILCTHDNKFNNIINKVQEAIISIQRQIYDLEKKIDTIEKSNIQTNKRKYYIKRSNMERLHTSIERESSDKNSKGNIETEKNSFKRTINQTTEPKYELNEYEYNAEEWINYLNSTKKCSIPNTLRIKILKRDNYRCVWCGKGVDDGIKLNVDHIVPINSQPGKRMTKKELNNPDNLRTLCHKCNIGKFNKLDNELTI